MQARKFKYDVIGLTETRRRHPLTAVYDTGENLFLETYDSRGTGGVALTNFVVYAPTPSYKEEVEAFYIDLEKFYREDHTFYKVIIGFNAKMGSRRTLGEQHIATTAFRASE
ncbi:hypothetical protein NECAME_09345 [Necator americanus]|uniref:Uncharacterized protein n=1 Tax=Necator americanus TaxID=51031 RepID=W2TF03_NECAM|nr:hypothetical protein NECAME_09345 [Necator americanus]ETN80179.1 hypothetical protein NECAME_09345 [Necator americanus]